MRTTLKNKYISPYSHRQFEVRAHQSNTHTHTHTHTETTSFSLLLIKHYYHHTTRNMEHTQTDGEREAHINMENNRKDDVDGISSYTQ